jgi:hypothetical protein
LGKGFTGWEGCGGKLHAWAALQTAFPLNNGWRASSPMIARAISARAFAPLPKLLTLSAPFSTSATCYVLPKGRSAAQELQELKPSIRAMFHVKHSLTDPDAGIIVKA